MKKIFSLFLLLTLTLPTFAQGTDAAPQKLVGVPEPGYAARNTPAGMNGFPIHPQAQHEIAVIDQKAPEAVPFAQPFALQFALSHTPGYAVDVDEETLPKGFTLTQMTATQNSPGTLMYDFTAVPFTLGVSTFTAVTFNLVDTNKKVLAATNSEPIHITVSPVKYFDDQELKEIRPPYIPANLWAWLTALAILIALILAIRHFIKNMREKAKTVSEPKDTRPSDVIALSKIDALLDSGLWEHQEYKLFYITLSDICREYLWRRFQIDAFSYTSDELLWKIKNIPALAPLKQKLREFLSSSDLVKFAKVIPQEQERNKDIQLLKEIVQDTSPRSPRPDEEFMQERVPFKKPPQEENK